MAVLHHLLIITLPLAALLWRVAEGAISVTVVSFPGPNTATPTLSGVLYLPSGYRTSTATFPAMVLMHGCSGIWSNRNVSARNKDNTPNLQNHIEKWGLKLAGQGIVALVVDSISNRKPAGVDMRDWQDQCGTADPSVDSYTVRVLDARAAYAYLIDTAAGLAPSIPSKVNSARVGLMGWSQGAQTVLTEAAESGRDSSTLRPDSDFLFRLPSITFYPGCGADLAFRTGSGSFWRPKFALRLNIGTMDDFYSDCQTRTTLAGSPSVFVGYTNATHSFDNVDQTWPTASCPSSPPPAGDTCAMKAADIDSLAFLQAALV
ncbi:hypothetical protein GOP47_0019136 [Adiantum capillus-veneris]|uniref:Uncharacterized protein n=1 Tax=Adiantum capillus-veneris TaxID=13818 RepID=A0A9D4UF13_ADICA|nr:hypothetical protein GOP47_0019136 [Adiantum capillus-veneris]